MSTTVEAKEPDGEEPHQGARRTSWLSVGTGFEPPTLGSILEAGALVFILLALIKLMAVAHGDPSLAVAILSATGYVSLIAWIVVSSIPLLAFSALYLIMIYTLMGSDKRLVGRMPDEPRKRGPGREMAFARGTALALLYFALILFLGSLTALYLPSEMFITTSVLLALYLIVLLATRFRRRPISANALRAIAGYRVLGIVLALVASAIFITGAALSPQEWTSVEEITTKGEKYYGVVLSSDARWTTILVYKPRQLEYVRTDQIVRRNMCKNSNLKPTVVQFFDNDFTPGGMDCRAGLQGNGIGEGQ